MPLPSLNTSRHIATDLQNRYFHIPSRAKTLNRPVSNKVAFHGCPANQRFSNTRRSLLEFSCKRPKTTSSRKPARIDTEVMPPPGKRVPRASAEESCQLCLKVVSVSQKRHSITLKPANRTRSPTTEVASGKTDITASSPFPGLPRSRFLFVCLFFLGGAWPRALEPVDSFLRKGTSIPRRSCCFQKVHPAVNLRLTRRTTAMFNLSSPGKNPRTVGLPWWR